jgi:hypothetical protein
VLAGVPSGEVQDQALQALLDGMHVLGAEVMEDRSFTEVVQCVKLRVFLSTEDTREIALGHQIVMPEIDCNGLPIIIKIWGCTNAGLSKAVAEADEGRRR